MSEAKRKRMWLDYLPLDELVRYPKNPKNHRLDHIMDSMARFGMAIPITIDETTGYISSGHGRIESLFAAWKAGENPPELVDVTHDGRWLVPVVRGVALENEAELEAFILAANQTTIEGGWNRDALMEMAGRLMDTVGEDGFKGTGFDPEELMGLAKAMEEDIPKAPDPKVTEDEKPEEKEKVHHLDALPPAPEPVTSPGDIWILGDHRVICGDSMDDAVVDKLIGRRKVTTVCTDPPYAVYGSSTGIGPDIADDRMVAPFFRSVVRQIWRVLPVNGHAYIHTDWRSWATLWEAARAAGPLTPKNCLVWDKGDTGVGSSYRNCHEFIGYFAKMPPAQATVKWGGQRAIYRPNILRHPRVTGEERQHNAAKPVALLSELIQNSSDASDYVLDLFGGSGSTIIAAENTRRRALVVEIEPKMVDLMVSRWEHITGKRAKLMRAENTPKKRTRRKA